MKNKDTKDLVMKEFEAYPDVAADLLNVFFVWWTIPGKREQSFGGTYRNVVSGIG